MATFSDNPAYQRAQGISPSQPRAIPCFAGTQYRQRIEDRKYRAIESQLDVVRHERDGAQTFADNRDQWIRHGRTISQDHEAS